MGNSLLLVGVAEQVEEGRGGGRKKEGRRMGGGGGGFVGLSIDDVCVTIMTLGNNRKNFPTSDLKS